MAFSHDVGLVISSFIFGITQNVGFCFSKFSNSSASINVICLTNSGVIYDDIGCLTYSVIA